MRRIKILLGSFLCLLPALAQQVSTPYSMYGYGILGDRATAMQRQMGGVGYAMNSGRQINVMNPASYAAVDSLTFLFDLGADMSILWSKEGSAKERTFGGGVDYLTMQFPICEYMGGSVGLIPYSNVGYAFGDEIKHGTMENQGSGGINELYLGVAGKYKGFSLGVNVSYDFGNIVNDVFAAPSAQGQTKFEHVMQIRDWNIVIGAQYTHRFNKFNSMVVGATFSPKKTLHGKSWATVQEMTQDSYPDTVGTLNLKNNYYTPNTIGVGVSFTHERVSRLAAEVDFTWQGWKDCKYSALHSQANPNVIAFDGMKFNNRTKFAAGVEYIPKLRGNYGQRIAYRLGGYYTNDYLRIGSNSVKEYGVTAGFGFPTVEGKTIINLGLEWKQRRATPETLISENYFNITLGVNFNEVWFFKRKIR
ncbi:MAG: hypothetical protein NC204_00465 [Candidatus Amulumruptor caecigallinarius]|nr:hypothetical protein [Candidatus Amulumruptor caecigallinarius]